MSTKNDYKRTYYAEHRKEIREKQNYYYKTVYYPRHREELLAKAKARREANIEYYRFIERLTKQRGKQRDIVKVLDYVESELHKLLPDLTAQQKNDISKILIDSIKYGFAGKKHETD